MPFLNDRQRSACCLLMLEQLNMEKLWQRNTALGETGPAPEASKALNDIQVGKFCRLSSGERIWLRTVFDFWDGTGQAPIYELMNRLEQPLLDMVGQLLSALAQPNSAAIDKWLNDWRAG